MNIPGQITQSHTHTSFTLPEGEKDDRLDDAELQHRVISAEQLTRGKVEEEQGIECQTDGDVVDDGDVQVATCWPGHRQEQSLFVVWSTWSLLSKHGA